MLVLTDTAGDVVCVVSDAAEGKWKSAAAGAAMAAVPFLSAAVVRGADRVVIRSTVGGEDLFSATSVQSQALRRALFEQTDLAAKYAELAPHFSVADRLKMVDAGKVFGEVLSSRKCRKIARERKIAVEPPPPGMRKPELQHDLPCNPDMQRWFMAHGIDVNDPAFTRWVERSKHRNIIHKKTDPYFPGGAWNQKWRDFIAAEPPGHGYTRDQVIGEMYRLRALDEFDVN